MGRASDLVDELVEEAPQGAANAFQIMLWIVAVVLAALVLLLVAVALIALL